MDWSSPTLDNEKEKVPQAKPEEAKKSASQARREADAMINPHMMHLRSLDKKRAEEEEMNASGVRRKFTQLSVE